jgi:hypothetical protein
LCNLVIPKEKNMRSSLSIGLRLSISALLVAGIVSLASAQTTTAATNHAAILKTLHEAHHLLVHADHDYDGHRAKAAEAVHRAIREIEGKHHRAAQSTTGAATATHTGQGKMHEAQGTSDSQLKQALGLLKSLSSYSGAKHPKVSAHVSEAISEICTALKIK